MARDLGMTVGHMETSMSNAELLEWMFFYQIEFEAMKEAELDAKLEARHRSRL